MPQALDEAGVKRLDLVRLCDSPFAASAMAAVTSPSERKPMSTDKSRLKLRSIKPAPMTRTTLSETSATTRPRRNHCRPLPAVVDWLFSRSVDCRSARAPRIAGISPKSTADSSAAPAAKTHHRTSSPISADRGTLAGSMAMSARTPA